MKETKYDAIIIGAGIGGLVCGCYLAKAGLRVLIIEQASIPGGYCTSFNRKGYIFDVGVHYLGSCRENKGVISGVLKDLDIFNRINLIDCDPYDKVIVPKRSFFISKNTNKTKQELIRFFPGEKENLVNFFKFILEENILVVFSKTKKKSFAELLNMFFNKKALELKSILTIPLGNLGLPSDRVSAFVAIMLYREYVFDGGYYPKGGIQKFPDLLASRFKEFNGEIRLSTKVTKIITKENKAIGVIADCEDEVIFANTIVSNCDAKYTFNELLDCCSQENKKLKTMEISASAFVIYLGINSNLTKYLEKHISTWLFSTYKIDNCYNIPKFYNLNKNLQKRKEIDYIVCHFPSLIDSKLAPESKSAVRLMFWVHYADSNTWNRYKECLYEMVLDKLERLIPNVRQTIEVKEIATPCSFYKRTLNTKGAIFGWSSIVNQADRNLIPCRTSKNGLYLTGSWVTSDFGQCGIPLVVLSGKTTAEAIKRDSKIKSNDKSQNSNILL